jgi:hypothetical protein
MAMIEREGTVVTELVTLGTVDISFEREVESMTSPEATGGEPIDVVPADAEVFVAPQTGIDIIDSAMPDLAGVSAVVMEVS